MQLEKTNRVHQSTRNFANLSATSVLSDFYLQNIVTTKIVLLWGGASVDTSGYMLYIKVIKYLSCSLYSQWKCSLVHSILLVLGQMESSTKLFEIINM